MASFCKSDLFNPSRSLACFISNIFYNNIKLNIIDNFKYGTKLFDWSKYKPEAFFMTRSETWLVYFLLCGFAWRNQFTNKKYHNVSRAEHLFRERQKRMRGGVVVVRIRFTTNLFLWLTNFENMVMSQFYPSSNELSW